MTCTAFLILFQGVHDWRNIQDVVRSTFKAFYDVMKFQGEAIRGLESAMESKAAKQEVTQRLEAIEAALRRKVDRNELVRPLAPPPPPPVLHTTLCTMLLSQEHNVGEIQFLVYAL